MNFLGYVCLGTSLVIYLQNKLPGLAPSYHLKAA